MTWGFNNLLKKIKVAVPFYFLRLSLVLNYCKLYFSCNSYRFFFFAQSRVCINARKVFPCKNPKVLGSLLI